LRYGIVCYCYTELYSAQQTVERYICPFTSHKGGWGGVVYMTH